MSYDTSTSTCHLFSKDFAMGRKRDTAKVGGFLGGFEVPQGRKWFSDERVGEGMRLFLGIIIFLRWLPKFF
jgi:hypothetical protein